jgi:hypothetical protein
MFLEGPGVPADFLAACHFKPDTNDIRSFAFIGQPHGDHKPDGCRYPILLSARLRRDVLGTVPGVVAVQVDYRCF